MSNLVNSLVDMGFTEEQSKEALDATGNQNLDAALNWIIEKNDTNNFTQPDTGDSTPKVNSYKCDECQKVLTSETELEFHAAKTGHSQFSESTEEKKPLTPEERKEQEKRILEIIRVKQAERLKREKEEEIEREKLRRESGRTLVEIREKILEEEMKKDIEARKREKASDKEHLDNLRAQIAREREEKKLLEQQRLTGIVPEPAKPVAKAPTAIKTDECRIQIRLPSGNQINETFKSASPLSSVYEFICKNWSEVTVDSIALSMTYPRKNFGDEDKAKKLVDLGLCPSASLVARSK